MARSSSRRRDGRPKSQNPSSTDVLIGTRLRSRRILMGMSQVKLGKLLGLTFQQIQKYERGANRITAARLYQLGQILRAPVSYFFSKETESQGQTYTSPGFGEEKQAPYEAAQEDPSIFNQEMMELAKAYHRINDPDVRKRVFELIKAIASTYDLKIEETPAN